jgi:hypothetical protein
MDNFLENSIKQFIKDQIICMSKEYSSRPQCLWKDGTKYIWINNTDYLVEILPDGTNKLMSPIDTKLINQIYDVIALIPTASTNATALTPTNSPNEDIMEFYYSQLNLCREAKQLIFMYYENHYIEWRDWYFIKNGDTYEIVSDPLGDYDHTPMANYLNNVLEKL